MINCSPQTICFPYFPVTAQNVKGERQSEVKFSYESLQMQRTDSNFEANRFKLGESSTNIVSGDSVITFEPNKTLKRYSTVSKSSFQQRFPENENYVSSSSISAPMSESSASKTS
jgi:hypothetical protein